MHDGADDLDHVLPLPYRDSRALVEIKESGKKGALEFGVPFLDLEQWHQRSRSLQEIAFYSSDQHISFFDGNTASAQVNAPQVSANMFAVLGVSSAMGRNFAAREDGSALPGEERNIILSDSIWRTTFGSDPQTLGKIVRLNGESCAVIGVMQPRFQPGEPQMVDPIEALRTE